MTPRRTSVGWARALLAGVLMAATTVSAQAARDSILPFDNAKSICAQFDTILPPPPPIGRAVVGTFDARTGEFTWHPTVTMRPNGRRDPRDWVVDLRPVFDRYQIRSVLASLDPAITSLPRGVRLLPRAINRTVFRAGTPAGAPGGSRPRGVPGPLGAPGSAGTRLPPEPAPLKGHPKDWFHSMYLPVEGGMQDLVFQVTNLPAGGEFTVTIDGRTVSNQGAADPNTVDILVPARGSVRFRVKAGGGGQTSTEFEETVVFDRPPVLGCFTLEALPILIVYEPPGSGSSQTYTTATRAGTTIKTFTATDSSTRRPVDTQFSRVADFAGMLKGLGGVLGALSAVNPAFGKVGTGLQTAGGILEKAWGTSETNETVRHTVTSEHTLTIEVAQSTATSTTAHLGPGRGDVISFLRKPVFAWLAAVDQRTGQLAISVSLLSFQTLATHSAEDLRRGQLPAPSPAAQKLLLALDPLTPESGQGYQMPDAERLVRVPPPSTSFSGAAVTNSYSRTVTRSDATTETTTRNITTTEVGGILGFISATIPQLGLDVPQTGEISITTVHGGSSSATVDSTVRVDVTLAADTGEYHEFQTYYDRTFGTFAFKEVPFGTDNLSGAVTTADGRPAAGAKVELVTQQGTFVTWTDASGRYAFRSRALRPGDHLLVVGGRRQPVRFEGRAARVDVRLDRALSTPPPRLPARPQPPGRQPR